MTFEEVAKAAKDLLMSAKETERKREQLVEALVAAKADGASLRELAEDAGISHQRVQQLVKPRFVCSSCNRSDDRAGQLVAGPGKFICGSCVQLGFRVIDSGKSRRVGDVKMTPGGQDAACSFCKNTASRSKVARTTNLAICLRCLQLAQEVLEEKGPWRIEIADV